jgi:hypothetical protein
LKLKSDISSLDVFRRAPFTMHSKLPTPLPESESEFLKHFSGLSWGWKE